MRRGRESITICFLALSLISVNPIQEQSMNNYILRSAHELSVENHKKYHLRKARDAYYPSKTLWDVLSARKKKPGRGVISPDYANLEYHLNEFNKLNNSAYLISDFTSIYNDEMRSIERKIISYSKIPFVPALAKTGEVNH